MHRNETRNFLLHTTTGATILTGVMAFVLVVLIPLAAEGQTFTTLHTFTGPDGAGPTTGLTMDQAGNFYGTTGAGDGSVFKLSRMRSNWILTPLYRFKGGPDGSGPSSRVVFGPDGALYGTTYRGGDSSCGRGGCGVVFRLLPPATACASVLCPWTEKVILTFTGIDTGLLPGGDLTFDAAGNIYGTTASGGLYQGGTVYKLTRSGSDWTETVLYNFGEDISGSSLPTAGVIFDNSGNLYGTSDGGAYGFGTVYELIPSGGGWTEKILHTFNNADGNGPSGGLIFGQAGNLYGTTEWAGPNGSKGTVFMLSPSGDDWTFNQLHSFSDGDGEPTGVTMDVAGNLYGATSVGGQYSFGAVFKLTQSTGGWSYELLHEFSNDGNGDDPRSPVFLDANGNIYGTTIANTPSGYCNGNGCGTVWEITP